MTTQKITTWILLAAFGIFSGGCATWAPSAESIAKADFGTPMSASQIRDQADQWLVKNLRDPDSRRVEWGEQTGRMWIWTGILYDGHKYGYGITASVNARNGFGGYTGGQPYVFLANNGTLTWGAKIEQGGLIGFIE